MYRCISYSLIFAFFAFSAVSAAAFPADTTKKRALDSVTVVSGLNRVVSMNRAFAVGTNVINVSGEVLSKIKTASLADYIRGESSVYLKEYGRGMGAFVSVRGTSSSHTSIAWNGMSMSVPTLGQADLSHIPVYFFDRMDLHIGGSSSLYGDGAIGGAIRLNTSPQWKRGVSGDILLSYGSYSTIFSGATLRYSNGSTESRTAVYHSSSANNYTFINNTKIGKPQERLNNASYSNFGFLQEVFHRFRDSSLISLNVMYLNFERDIQPPVSLNDRPESYASIFDENLRVSAQYNAVAGKLAYTARVAYSYDYELYKQDIIAASRLLAGADVQYSSGSFLVKSGASYEYIVPTANSFADSVKESRTYIYSLVRYSPSPFVAVSSGVRVGRVTNGDVPLMPSADIRVTPVRASGHTLSLRGSVSGNGKIPSINDRYWGGLQTHLESEVSTTTEGGADYSLFSGRGEISAFFTVYRSDVKNWIRWLPAGQVWRPRNIPRVLSKGAETGIVLSGTVGHYKVKISCNYSYTDIEMKEGLWYEDPAIGQQLAYQPYHSLRASANVYKGTYNLYVSFSYTGERTTLDIFDRLPSYTLTDIGFSHKGELFNKRFTLSGVVRNILDVQYQNVKFYAMPGRNWQLSLRFFF